MQQSSSSPSQQMPPHLQREGSSTSKETSPAPQAQHVGDGDAPCLQAAEIKMDTAPADQTPAPQPAAPAVKKVEVVQMEVDSSSPPGEANTTSQQAPTDKTMVKNVTSRVKRSYLPLL